MGAHMEVKWLEDFIALAQCNNFSRAAELRNLTQSGFSRRIRALEQWVGAALVDRSTYPPSITAAGEMLLETARDVVHKLVDTRTVIRTQQRMPGAGLLIAAGHTIALNFLPSWLTTLANHHINLSARVTATNGHDSIMMLVNGSCELVLVYHHPDMALMLDPVRYDFVTVGRDALLPVSRATPQGQPMHRLPGRADHPVPLLSYTETSYFGRGVKLIVKRANPSPELYLRYESDMAEVLKRMALQGHGMAWVPASSIQRELDIGELVPSGAPAWHLDLEIRAYRDLTNQSPALEKLWSYLKATA